MKGAGYRAGGQSSDRAPKVRSLGRLGPPPNGASAAEIAVSGRGLGSSNVFEAGRTNEFGNLIETGMMIKAGGTVVGDNTLASRDAREGGRPGSFARRASNDIRQHALGIQHRGDRRPRLGLPGVQFGPKSSGPLGHRGGQIPRFGRIVLQVV